LDEEKVAEPEPLEQPLSLKQILEKTLGGAP
jgi:hypothetical protein